MFALISPFCSSSLFFLQVKGSENYEILCKIRNSLELVDTMPKQVVETYKRQQNERWV